MVCHKLIKHPHTLQEGLGRRVQALPGTPRCPALALHPAGRRGGALSFPAPGPLFPAAAPGSARGRALIVKGASPSLTLVGNGDAGPGRAAGTLQTPQTSPADLAQGCERARAEPRILAICTNPALTPGSSPAERPRPHRPPGSWRRATWPPERCGPSVRETRAERSRVSWDAWRATAPGPPAGGGMSLRGG